MTCEVIQSECLKIGDRVPIVLDFTQLAARRWRRAALFSTDDVIRGRNAGFEFVASNDGQTGDREPKWPKTAGGTVTDGSITWTAQVPSIDSLVKVLSSVTWTAPSGITVSGETINAVAQTAMAYIEPTATGTFEVLVRPTFDDSPAHKEGFIIEIEVN